MEFSLSKLFNVYLEEFDLKMNQSNQSLNEYLSIILNKKNKELKEKYIYESLIKISKEDNIFRKKRLLIELSENSLFKIGFTPYSVALNNINNFSYYKDTILFGYSSLNKIQKSHIYKNLLKDINYNILKLNYVSINLMLDDRKKEELKFNLINNNLDNEFLVFLKKNSFESIL